MMLCVLCVESKDDWLCGCNQWYVLSAVTFIIGAVGLSAVFIIRFTNYTSYSHSVLFVYSSIYLLIYLFIYSFFIYGLIGSRK